MSWLKLAERLRSSLVAVIAGWLAGLVVTLPMELSVAWRNTDGQPRLVAESFIFGMVIWATITLVVTLVGWLVAAVPLVLIFPPASMRARKNILLIAISAAALALPARLFGLFTVWKKVAQFDAHNFFTYAGFGVSVAVVSLLVYLRLEEPSGEDSVLNR